MHMELKNQTFRNPLGLDNSRTSQQLCAPSYTLEFPLSHLAVLSQISILDSYDSFTVHVMPTFNTLNSITYLSWIGPSWCAPFGVNVSTNRICMRPLLPDPFFLSPPNELEDTFILLGMLLEK